MKRMVIGILVFVVLVPMSYAKGHIQDGLCKVFLRDGQESFFILEMHRGGKRDGASLQFYPDGTVEKMAWYRNGILNGAYKTFWSDGAQKTLLEYQNGILNGQAHRYDREGRPLFEASYADGKLQGEGRYYEDGILTKTVEYRDGRAVQIK